MSEIIQKPNELIVFTHSDLDALGCMLNIEHKFPGIEKKFHYTNYANIPEIVQNIVDYAKENGNKHMIIADVSFSDNKEYLQKLYDTGLNITYIDHHLYPEGFFDTFPNMKVKWDKTRSATLLCYEYFNNQNPLLGRLSAFIDIYDLWQVDHPVFDASQSLNDYFWEHDIYHLFNKFLDSGYDFPSDYKEVTERIKSECATAIAAYEASKCFFRVEKITFAFIEKDWFNHVLIREMKNGQDVVVGISNYGVVRVRINKDAKISDEQKTQLRLELAGAANTGHMNSFTYKCDNTTKDDLFKEAQKLVTLSLKYT